MICKDWLGKRLIHEGRCVHKKAPRTFEKFCPECFSANGVKISGGHVPTPSPMFPSHGQASSQDQFTNSCKKDDPTATLKLPFFFLLRINVIDGSVCADAISCFFVVFFPVVVYMPCEQIKMSFQKTEEKRRRKKL